MDAGDKETKTGFYILWMHRTRYHKEGRLDIRRTAIYYNEKLVKKKFREYTASDFACQLVKCVVHVRAMGNYLGSPEVIDENAVWKRRQHQEKKRRLKDKIDLLEAKLEAAKVEYEALIQ